MNVIFQSNFLKKAFCAVLLCGSSGCFGNDQEPTKPKISINEDEFDTILPIDPTIDISSDNVTQDHDTQDSVNGEMPNNLSAAEQEKYKEQCELVLKKVLDNFAQIDFALEHIALVINHNQIRIKDNQPLLEEITKLRSLTNMVLNSAFTEVNPQKIAHLADLAHQLVAHIRYVLTTDLVSFTPFDLQSALPSRSASDVQQTASFEQIEKQLTQNKGLITRLESESENVGLNIFNIIFRRLEKLDDDYKIINKCLWGLGIAGGVTLAACMIDSYYHAQANKLYKKICAYFGYTANQAQGEKELESSNGTNKYYQNAFRPYSTKTYTESDSSDNALSNNDMFDKAEFRNRLSHVNDDWINDVPWYKKFLGDRPDPEQPLEITQVYGRPVGQGTRLINLLEKNIGLVSFALPAYPLYQWYGPKLLEVWKETSHWFSTKKSQLASFLRGGPIKKALGKFERDTKVTFDDIIGNEHAKMIFQPVISYLLDYEKFDRGGIPISNAFLLVGNTRAGKTHFVDGFVGEVKKKLQERNDPRELHYWGLDAAELKKHGVMTVLMVARYYAPIVVFIDEIDKGRFQNDGDAAALCELQVAMSMLNTDISKKVIVIAATNRPENLDASLRADGRFGTRIPFVYPTFEERKEYITRELNKRAAIIDEYYIDRLAHETENANYDTLKNIIIIAFQRAKIDGVSLTGEHLDHAVNEKFHKIIFDEISLPEKELYAIAIHQSAHALMRVLLQPSLQLTKVTIRPVSPDVNETSVHWDKDIKKDILEYGHSFTAHDNNALKFSSYDDLVRELQICLAGHIAEKVLLDSSSYSYHNHDTQQAFDIAKQIVLAGMQEKDMPKVMREQKLTEAYEIVKKYEQEVTAYLTDHKRELRILANILLEQKILSADEIMAILKLIEDRKKETKEEITDGDTEVIEKDSVDSTIEK